MSGRLYRDQTCGNKNIAQSARIKALFLGERRYRVQTAVWQFGTEYLGA